MRTKIVHLSRQALINILSVLGLKRISTTRNGNDIHDNLIQDISTDLVGRNRKSHIVHNVIEEKNIGKRFKDRAHVIDVKHTQLVESELNNELGLNIYNNEVENNQNLIITSKILTEEVGLIRQLNGLKLVGQNNRKGRTSLKLSMNCKTLNEGSSGLASSLLTVTHSSCLLSLTARLQLALLKLEGTLKHNLYNVSLKPLGLSPLNRAIRRTGRNNGKKLIIGKTKNVKRRLTHSGQSTPSRG